MQEEGECCCVCLDSLSSEPVVCLLRSYTGKRRVCRHFIHARCAKRLRPRKCPLCRKTFSNLSAEIGKDDFSKLSMKEILRGIRAIDGELEEEKEEESVRTDTVLEILAALCPVNKIDLERATEKEKKDRLSKDQVRNLMKMCDIFPADRRRRSINGDIVVVTQRFKSYNMTTIIRRFIRSALLRLAGAVGTSLCSSVCGGLAGISMGALVSIPPESVLEIDISGRAYAIEITILILKMLYFGLQRRDLLYQGVLWGSLSGGVLGWIGALLIVHPEGHGFRKVFLSGLKGHVLRRLLYRYVLFRGSEAAARFLPGTGPVNVFESNAVC